MNTRILRRLNADDLATAIAELGPEWCVQAAYYGSNAHHAIVQRAVVEQKADKPAPVARKPRGTTNNKARSSSRKKPAEDSAAE